MKNWQKSVFLFLGVLIIASGAPSGFSENGDVSISSGSQGGYAESEAVPMQTAQDPIGVSAISQSAPVVSEPMPSPGATAPASQSEFLSPASSEEQGISQTEQILEAAMPSGLLEVDGYKYPVYLYAPKDYRPDRTYAMIMIAPAESAVAQQQIDYFTGLAQRKSIFILAPYVLWPQSGDTPYKLDEWFLSVKQDILERFPINKKRVYLVGQGSGAQYAAYLAVKYPGEFGAAALLGKAWDGPFSELVEPRSNAEDQIPFYIAMKTDGDAKARNQTWFDRFQQKGYPIQLTEYATEDDLNQMDFKKSFFDWLEEASQNWSVKVAENQKGWKTKFKKGVKDFFAV